MTQELLDTLDANLATAKSTGDQRTIDEAQQAYLKANARCQMKTSERIKAILAMVNDIDAREKLRDAEKQGVKKGAEMLFKALRYLVAAGGGAAVLRLLGG